jgi:hypothetical protein
MAVQVPFRAFFDGGILVRPEVLQSQVEEARKASQRAYEHEGFVWDEDAQGWYMSRDERFHRYGGRPVPDIAAEVERLGENHAISQP